MKTFKILFCAFMLPLLATAQESKPEYDLRISYTGSKDAPITIKTRYCKGTMLKCGTQTKIAPNGVVIFKARYHNDKYEGAVRSYYPDGKLKEERFYENGKEKDIRTHYFHNGKVQSTQMYANNKREGEGKKYYENGILQESFTYENDRKEGLREEFDKKGILSYQTLYSKGRKLWMKQYDEQGHIIQEISCRWKACY